LGFIRQETAMSAFTTWLRKLQLTHFSKPIEDRCVYRTMATRPVRKMVEIGIGTGQRSLQMIEMAGFQAPRDQLLYVGIDLFESRPKEHGPGLNLKQAHKLLSATGAQVRLLPGDPYSVLSRMANSFQEIDLVVISANLDRQSMARAWFFLPRMLYPKSLVLVESTAKSSGQEAFRPLPTSKVAEIAAKAANARRAA
jgi:hypothetical protein